MSLAKCLILAFLNFSNLAPCALLSIKRSLVELTSPQLETASNFGDTINVVNYGIQPNETVDISFLVNQLISFAPSTGRTIYFPEGHYIIGSKIGILLSHSNITILGASGGKTIFLPGGRNIWRMIQSETSVPYIHDINIRNIVFKCKEGSSWANGAISIYGKRIINFLIDSCTFLDASPNYILASNVINFQISACTFTGTGEINSGTFIYLSGGTNIKFIDNSLWNYYNGICVIPQNPISKLSIIHNVLDGVWYLSKGNFNDRGNGIRYTDRSLVDSNVNFYRKGVNYKTDDVGRWHLVRVFINRGSGRAIMDGHLLLDSDANFNKWSIIPGEIIESGNKFGIIDHVVSNGCLKIERWFDKNTMNRVNKPVGQFNYLCLGIYLGRINKVTTHSIFVDCWHNLSGQLAVPPLGATYEVIRQLPMYGLNISSGHVCGVIEDNRFLRNYGDQISVYSGGFIIRNNYIMDGQDMGITVYNMHNLKSIVEDNVIKRPGTCGIFIRGDSNIIVHNTITGPLPTVNLTLSDKLGGIRLDGGVGNVIDSNTINLEYLKTGLNGSSGIVMEKKTLMDNKVRSNNFIGVVGDKIKIWTRGKITN